MYQWKVVLEEVSRVFGRVLHVLTHFGTSRIVSANICDILKASLGLVIKSRAILGISPDMCQVVAEKEPPCWHFNPLFKVKK